MHSEIEILNSCKVKNIITTSSRMGSGSHLKKSKNNINNAHAYSILDAKEFQQKNGENLRLLKVRNPWGRGEWNGDYSDDSPKWTSELKEFFHFNEAEGANGIFFIPFEYFIEEFRVVVICYLDKKKSN